MDLIEDLAHRMKGMRAAGADPYVLLLGAGASIASGTSLNRAVVERVVGRYDVAAFDDYLRRCSDDERFGVLRELVEGAAPSPGYHALAELVRAGYFDVVLSTNFDPLLDDAIAAQRMRRRDYVLLVHGVMPPDLISRHFARREPRVKLLKLHGDLFYRSFFYTGEEIREFPDELQDVLNRFLNQHDVVIVGHAMGDQDINRCLRPTGGSIWYVNRRPPPPDLATLMKARHSEGNEIVDEAGSFDAFFTRLRALLLRDTAEVSVDEIAQSIFSLSAPGRLPVGSGFLLEDTGLVVTDATILADLQIGGEPGVRAQLRPFAGGPDLQALLVVAPKTMLDYAVFRLETPVAPSPLGLAAGVPTVGDPVTACISHGQTQGFHDARVTAVGSTVPVRGREGRVEQIRDLIELNLHVEEGSCGSPVVAKDGKVVGVIVAGNGVSYALTAPKLRATLEKAGLAGKAVRAATSSGPAPAPRKGAREQVARASRAAARPSRRKR